MFVLQQTKVTQKKNYVDCDSGALEIKENAYIHKYRI